MYAPLANVKNLPLSSRFSAKMPSWAVRKQTDFCFLHVLFSPGGVKKEHGEDLRKREVRLHHQQAPLRKS
jgi:hypothetical protein